MAVIVRGNRRKKSNGIANALGLVGLVIMIMVIVIGGVSLYHNNTGGFELLVATFLVGAIIASSGYILRFKR